MSSRAIEYPRISAALSGLGLTTQLAAAAADSIPIAKLVLGVVSRIVTLASDIEKSRDALQQLAGDARKMGDRIASVVPRRQLSPEIERSLRAIYEVLRSIETLFEKHKAKNPFHKALSYAFTTSKRIDGLSQELSRATQELLWVVAIDTNAQVRENAAHIGEFTRIRLCDVDELALISEHKIVWTGYSAHIYSGRVDGRVIVLRCFERNTPVGPDEESYWDKELRREVIRHDQLLEKLSMVPSLHRNIARLYGRNSREHFDRFNVMKSVGSRISKFNERPVTIASTWNILVDAASWLENNGISWIPESSSAVFIDSADAPIIGLHNDLSTCDAKRCHIIVLGAMLEHAYSAHWKQSWPMKGALDFIFGTEPVPGGISRRKTTVPRRLIPTLNAKVSTYIGKALQSLGDSWDVWAYTETVILHAAAFGCTVGSTVYMNYYKNDSRRPVEDSIFMVRVHESDNELVHGVAFGPVATSMTDMFRNKLGMSVDVSVDRPQYWVSASDPSEPASMRFMPLCL